MKRKTVLIVDPSRMAGDLFTKLIAGIDDFDVCGNVPDVSSAVSAVTRSKPDMILLATEIPGRGRAKFLRRLLPQYTVPVIAVCGDSDDAAELLAAGAADIVTPPDISGMAAYRKKLTAVLKNALNLREVCCEGVVYRMRRGELVKIASDKRLILIGGSTGSTEALPVILAGLGKDVPPIAATLHMPGGYTAMYAKRLTAELRFDAFEAQDSMPLTSGSIVIAQGSKHLRITTDGASYIARVTDGERISGHCPSVDALFLSAAALDARRIIAVLLTGMGSDGAIGMRKLRESGAFTIGQDEKSSVVYGMPKAAFDMGGVGKQCPLERIAAEIKQKLKEWT